MNFVKIILNILCIVFCLFCFDCIFNVLFWGTFHRKLQRLVERNHIDYKDDKPVEMTLMKACPLDKNKCDRCIYSIYRENPNLPKRCEMEWSKYE